MPKKVENKNFTSSGLDNLSVLNKREGGQIISFSLSFYSVLRNTYPRKNVFGRNELITNHSTRALAEIYDATGMS